MKKILIGLLALASFGFTAEIVRVEKNVGASIPLFSSNDAEINLDTSEIDTSNRWLYVGNRAIRTYTDTIGTAWMRCDDSAGTDSVGGRLIFYGNPHPEGKAIWTAIDSVTIAAASGAETQTSKVLVNSGRHQLIRAVIRNQLVPAAGKKSVCRNVRLNIPPLLNPLMP